MYNKFDHFSKEKFDFLKKKDKSKKGCIDEGIKNIIDTINSKNDYYTTSSCAGRIVLLEIRSKKKNECKWIFTKHDKVNILDIFDSLRNQKSQYEVWFKQQPLIIHIACRNLESAKIMLNAVRKTFRRAGIISISNRRIMVEIIGDERLETIVADKNFVCDEIFVKNLIKYANKNFVENKRKSERFSNLLKNL